jgi:hypothetical protein
MRPPTERDQCQAKLDILIEGFMRADWTTYRDAAAWLRDFADQKNIERGRVMCALIGLRATNQGGEGESAGGTVQEILMSHVVGEPTGASLGICGRRNGRLGPPFV